MNNIGRLTSVFTLALFGLLCDASAQEPTPVKPKTTDEEEPNRSSQDATSQEHQQAQIIGEEQSGHREGFG